MIDIGDTIYEVLTSLPNVEHVSIDDDDEKIYLIVKTKDGTKEALVLTKREMVLATMAQVDYVKLDTTTRELIE